jgi:hypothetical protein
MEQSINGLASAVAYVPYNQSMILEIAFVEVLPENHLTFEAAVAKAVADLPVWPNGALMYLSPAERAADGVREQLTKLLAAMSSGWDDKGAKGAEVKDVQ